MTAGCVQLYIVHHTVGRPPNEPNYPDGSSIGASLRALHEGINLNSDTLTRGWLVVVSADNPAAATLTGTMVGTSAVRFCRQCTVSRHTAGFDWPCSFVSPSGPSAPPLRTQADRTQDINQCGDCEADMNAAGWKTWAHAFIRCGPYFDFLQCVPEDLMHDEAEGILKGEVAHFIFYCTRIKEYFELDDLNRQLDQYQFPGRGKPVPYFTEGFLTGDTATKVAAKKAKTQKTEPTKKEVGDPRYVPKPGAHVHMTAGQMLTFALHSPQIFRDVGVPADDPALLCWLDHMEYLRLLMKHSITQEEVLEIDRLITKHQEGLKSLSKIYPNIWKPKHHYVCHIPLDILHFGPPRHYWCMRFEAMNQVFQRIAIGGTYRDTTRRCAEFWCMRSALARQNNRTWEDWALTQMIQGSETLYYTLDTAPAHVLETIDTWPDSFGDSVTTSYIDELKHNGHIIIAGTSWLLLTLDTTQPPVLASVQPRTGIFTVDSSYYFNLAVYSDMTLSNPNPMRTAHIPSSSELTSSIISLDEILEMTVLWPSKCEDSETGSMWTFVEM